MHMQGLFLTGGFYHLRRFTEIKVSTTSELFSTRLSFAVGIGCKGSRA
jgi:hypothetical protein